MIITYRTPLNLLSILSSLLPTLQTSSCCYLPEMFLSRDCIGLHQTVSQCRALEPDALNPKLIASFPMSLSAHASLLTAALFSQYFLRQYRTESNWADELMLVAFWCSYLVTWMRSHDRHPAVAFFQKHPQCIQFTLQEIRSQNVTLTEMSTEN